MPVGPTLRRALSAAALAVACSPDYALPPKAAVHCGPGQRCPAGYACQERVGRCVPTGGGDREPPEVEAGSVVVQPRHLRRDARLTVSFRVNGALAFPPEVVLAGAGSSPLTLVEEAGEAYTFSYTPTGDEAEGPAELSVTLVDAAGNLAADVPLGTVTFDFSAPRLQGNPAAEPSWLRHGAVATVRLRVSEPLPEDHPPVVRCVGHRDWTLQPIEEDTWVLTYEADEATDAPGEAEVTVALTDAAGNTTEESLGTVHFDFTAPEVLASEPGPEAVREGGVVRAEVRASEPLAAAELTCVTAAGEEPLAIGDGEEVGDVWSWSYKVGGDDVEGPYDCEVALADRAGNRSAVPLPTGFAIDLTAPAVVHHPEEAGHPLNPEIAPDRALRDGDRLTLTFSATEPLPVPPVVFLGDEDIGPPVAVVGGRYVYGYAVTGAPGDDGSRGLTVELEDAAGNRTSDGRTLGRVTFDLTPPRLVGVPSLTRCDGFALARLASNELWLNRPACDEGEHPLTVAFVLSELPPAGREPLVRVGEAERPVDMAGSLPPFYVAHHEPTGEEPPGADGVPVTVDTTDAAGNDVTLPLGRVYFDFTAPDLATDEGLLTRLVWVRDPWGSEASRFAPRTSVRVAPGVVESPHELRVWRVTDGGDPETDPEGEAYLRSLLATARLEPGADEPLEVLAGQIDEPLAHVTLLDLAGNESDADPDRGGTQAAPLRAVEWVATLNGRDVSDPHSSPHDLLFAFPDAGGLLRPDLDLHRLIQQEAVLAVARPGDRTSALSTTALAPWRPVDSEEAPAARFDPVLVDDQRRRRLVLFGGLRSQEGAQGPDGQSFHGDTWEWDGRRWVKRSPKSCHDVMALHGDPVRVCMLLAGPAPRSEAGAVLDPVTGRVVVHGGRTREAGPACDPEGPGGCADLWEWDGTDWILRHAGGAESARRTSASALAYDLRRRVVVLFGGRRDPHCAAPCDETWEWDRAAWTRRAPDQSPPGRLAHALAWDPGRERVVLFGGAAPACDGGHCDDTWAYDGETWTPVESPERPEGRRGHDLVLDPDRGQLLLVGGHADDRHFADLWALGQDGWERLPLASDGTPAVHGAAAWSSADQTVAFVGTVLDGGPCEAVGQDRCTATWLLREDGWELVSPLPRPAAGGGIGAWDAARGVIVRAGTHEGRVGVWEWDGRRWWDRESGEGPPGRDDAAAAYDERHAVTVLFGGLSEEHGLLADTWEWDGEAWTERHPEHAPTVRDRHLMAWDPIQEVVLLFGGRGDAAGACGDPATPGCDDTWAWDGTDWRELPAAERPPAYSDTAPHAITTDPVRRRVVLAGGELMHPWEWDGLGWRQVEADPHPSRRVGHGIAYDPVREVVTLVGGVPDEQGTGAEHAELDTWDWDGGAWSVREPLVHPGRGWGSALTFDAVRGELVVWPRQEADTWTYAPQLAVPHLLVTFDLESTQTLRPSAADPSERRLSSYGLRVDARGRGHTLTQGGPDDGPVPGWVAAVSALGRGGWVPVHDAPNADALARWEEDFDTAWHHGDARWEEAGIESWVGRDGRLTLDLATRAPQGATARPAELVVDYVELRARYWRTGCEVPNPARPAGTQEGAPCTDGDPATDGETCQTVGDALRCVAP